MAEETSPGFFGNLKNRPVLTGLLVVAVLSVLILVGGLLYSSFTVTWSDKDLPVFPEEDYQPASQAFDSGEEMAYIGVNELRTTILAVMGDLPANYPVNKVFEILTAKYKDQQVVVGVLAMPESDSAIDAKYRQMRKVYNNEIARLKRTRPANKAELTAELKKKLASNYSLYQFSTKLTISPEIYIPYSRRYEGFSFVAGPFGRFEQKQDHTFVYKADQGRAVITREFLKTAKVPDGVAAKADLVADKEKLDTILRNDWAELKDKHLKMAEKGKAEAVHGRREARTGFYTRWFATILLVLVTLLVSKLLAKFLGVVQRKDFPPEPSSDQFFAVPVTAKILHWLAVILVVAGMVELWLDAVVVLFTGHPWVVGRCCTPEVNLRYAVLGPVLTTLGIVVGAWVLVLKSELGIFFSTVYHSLQKRQPEPADPSVPAAPPEPDESPKTGPTGAKKKK